MTQVEWSTLRTLHDKLLQAATQIIEVDREEARPQVLILRVTEDGDVDNLEDMPGNVVARFFRDGLGKEALGIFIRGVLDATSPVRQEFIRSFGFAPNVLAQVNEAWMSAADRATPLEQMVPPSEDPARQECLLISLHTAAGTVLNIHKIVGTPRRVVPAPFPATAADAMQVSGRLSVQGSEPRTVH